MTLIYSEKAISNNLYCFDPDDFDKKQRKKCIDVKS